MKKITLLTVLAILSLLSFAHAQSIGINTSTPKSTMDVNGQKDASGNLKITDITGMQAPRLTRAELTAKGNTLYGIDQTGALAYITDITGGDNASQRINITATGYFYFDGTVWVKVGNGGAAAPTLPQTVLVASGTETTVVNSSASPLDISSVVLNTGGKITITSNVLTFNVAGTFKIDAFISTSDGSGKSDAFLYKNSSILVGYGFPGNSYWPGVIPVSYIGAFDIGDKLFYRGQQNMGGGVMQVISLQVQQIN